MLMMTILTEGFYFARNTETSKFYIQNIIVIKL